MTVFTPPHVAGAFAVVITTVAGASATTNANQYTYNALPPVVTSITPTSGKTIGGESITIYGSYLSTTTNIYFGGINVPFYVVGPTEITVTAPAGNIGTVNVEVITSGGAAYSPQPYTYVTPYNTIQRKR